jgi:DNA-directed RNA polymerase subunit RPC12/RpoP
MAEKTCIQCGSNRWVSGKVLGAGLGAGALCFRPDRMPFLTFKTAVPISARVCMDCGSLEMAVDTLEVAALKADPGLHCRKCGYNLTGNTSGICPECGETI